MTSLHPVVTKYLESLDQVINETVPALRELQKEGKVRFVGVSGYPLNVPPSLTSPSRFFRSPNQRKVLLYVAQRVKLDFVLTYCHYNLQNTLLEEYLPGTSFQCALSWIILISY